MFRTLGRVCYALAAISVFLSIGTQYKMGRTVLTQKSKGWRRESARDDRSERLSIFVGLWAPTFAITGKILEDMGREQETKNGTSFVGQPSENGLMPADQRSLSGVR